MNDAHKFSIMMTIVLALCLMIMTAANFEKTGKLSILQMDRECFCLEKEKADE